MRIWITLIAGWVCLVALRLLAKSNPPPWIMVLLAGVGLAAFGLSFIYQGRSDQEPRGQR